MPRLYHTSQKQREANRQNALKSTGPRTIEGRAISSGNALKHGLRAARHLLPGEDAAAYDALGDGLTTQLQPVGVLEAELVDRLVSLFWRARRIPAIEAALVERQAREADWELGDDGYDLVGLGEDDAPADGLRSGATSKAPLDLGRVFEVLLRQDMIAKLSRYDGDLQRRIKSTLAELRDCQSERLKREEAKRARTDIADAEVLEVDAPGSTAA